MTDQKNKPVAVLADRDIKIANVANPQTDDGAIGNEGNKSLNNQQKGYTMTDKTKNSPEVKLKDYSIRLSGFRSSGKNGYFLSFVPQRLYKQGDTIKYTDSFSGDDLLKLERLCRIAYDEHKAFQRSEHEKRKQQTSPQISAVSN